MPRLDALNLRESSVLFGADSAHLPVRLNRLPRARMLWLNQRVMRSDPRFAEAGGTAQAYVSHLLACCAYAMAADNGVEPSNDTVIGFADRYGGTGIGHNGGSGRAAVVNGYHVKGIGRTPLVSVLADEAHASGGAYLEECVRETIFSELVAAEFPAGSIPTLAIIETGEFQVWDTDDGPKPERRCLLVRPCFVRPAHFERAAGFISANAKEGALDAARVRQFFELSMGLWGREELVETYQRFWLRWAEQLAYAFVHRLPHGGNTSSNICLDGRLLDFGGTAAMPSWARASIMLGGPPTGAELMFLSQAVLAIAPFLTRHLDVEAATQQWVARTVVEAAQRYTEVGMREMLRLAGLTGVQARALLADDHDGILGKALVRVRSHYQREQFTIFDGTPTPRIPWNLDQIWSARPPEHFFELRGLLERRLILTATTPSLTGDMVARGLARRSTQRARSRDHLYREKIKHDVYAALDGALQGDALTLKHVSNFIAECVARNRRDGPTEPEDALPLGYAGNATASYALFECQHSGQHFAVQEWSADEAAHLATSSDDRIAIKALTASGIDFADPARLRFDGTVAMH